MPEPYTTILLIRHAETAAIGRCLVGRLPGIGLTDEGVAQARRLPARVARHAIEAIYASPLDRAVETAAPLARERGLPVIEHPDLIEVDFGAWTGATFEGLENDHAWRRFNTHRATAEVPGGESASVVQARAVRAVAQIAAAHAGGAVAAVTHGDVIRAAVLHYAGVSLDHVHRFEISPASVTAVLMNPAFVRFLYINEQDTGSP